MPGMSLMTLFPQVIQTDIGYLPQNYQVHLMDNKGKEELSQVGGGIMH